MNPKPESKIGPKSLSDGPFDNSATILRNFWEYLESSDSQKPSQDVITLMLKLMSKAQDVIAIYTPKLLLPEIIRECDKAQKRGVRIYALTADLPIHQKQFSYGIMREQKEIISTFLLIDPKKKEKGMWVNKELTTNAFPSISIDLDASQVRELFAHFCARFWTCSGQEIFFGKVREIVKQTQSLPNVPMSLEHTFLRGAEDTLDEFDLSTLSMQLPIPEGFHHYLTAKRLNVQLGEKIRELIPGLDFHWTELWSCEDEAFGFIECDRASTAMGIVFGWDLFIILTETQRNALKQQRPIFGNRYYPEKEIGDIKGTVLLESSNWDVPNFHDIQSITSSHLNDVQALSIEDWMTNQPKPDFPDEPQLARKITYTWNLLPPRTPKKAKKHRLYDQWEKFDKQVEKFIEQLIGDISQAISQEKGFKLKKTTRIIKKSQWESWISDLRSYENLQWRYQKDITDVKRIMEKIANIKSEFAHDISGIKSDKKAEEKNELEEFFSLSDKSNIMNIAIPHETVPKFGVLYEHGPQLYLAIQSVEQYDESQAIARKHKATIVAKRGE